MEMRKQSGSPVPHLLRRTAALFHQQKRDGKAAQRAVLLAGGLPKPTSPQTEMLVGKSLAGPAQKEQGWSCSRQWVTLTSLPSAADTGPATWLLWQGRGSSQQGSPAPGRSPRAPPEKPRDSPGTATAGPAPPRGALRPAGTGREGRRRSKGSAEAPAARLPLLPLGWQAQRDLIKCARWRLCPPTSLKSQLNVDGGRAVRHVGADSLPTVHIPHPRAGGAVPGPGTCLMKPQIAR